MKVLVVGAGAHGAACAAVLARQPGVDRVLLGGRRLDSAEEVRAWVGGSKIVAAQFDAQEPSTIVQRAFEILDTVDVVIDLTPSLCSLSVMRAALALGAHYVNTSACLEHAEQWIARKPLDLAEEFSSAGRTALIGCGASVGVSNIVCRLVCDRLDTVERIEIRAGVHTPAQKAALKTWTPALSPEQQYRDFCIPPRVFRNGRHESVPPFHEPESYDFGGNLGELVLTHHHHEAPYSLPLTVGKGIRYCSFKYPLEPAVATFFASGFTPERTVVVDGLSVRAVDVLMRLLPRPSSSALLDAATQQQTVPSLGDTRFHILIKGSAGGQAKSFRIESGLFFDQAQKALEMFGTANVPVAYAAVTGALLLHEGRTKTGIAWPEELDALRFVGLANTLGLTLNLNVAEEQRSMQ